MEILHIQSIYCKSCYFHGLFICEFREQLDNAKILAHKLANSNLNMHCTYVMSIILLAKINGC